MRGVELEAVDRGECCEVSSDAADSGMEAVRPRQCFGDQMIDGVHPVGEGLADSAQHVGFHAQIRPYRVGEVCAIQGCLERLQRGGGGRRALQQNVRPREGELEPCSRDNQSWR